MNLIQSEMCNCKSFHDAVLLNTPPDTGVAVNLPGGPLHLSGCRSRMSLSLSLLHRNLLLGCHGNCCHGDIVKKIKLCLTECVDKVKT